MFATKDPKFKAKMNKKQKSGEVDDSINHQHEIDSSHCINRSIAVTISPNGSKIKKDKDKDKKKEKKLKGSKSQDKEHYLAVSPGTSGISPRRNHQDSQIAEANSPRTTLGSSLSPEQRKKRKEKDGSSSKEKQLSDSSNNGDKRKKKKRDKKSNPSGDSSPPTFSPLSDNNGKSDQNPSEREGDESGGSTVDKEKKKREFHKWAELSGDFADLTEMMQDRTPAVSEAAMMDHNMYKNRYGNVLPNADTIVKLKYGSEGESYINANFVKGVDNTVYIASQAPLPNTFNDFWLMIWEQKVKVIVMLTRLQENNKTKAEVYWPTRGALGQTLKAGKRVPSRGRFESYGKVSVCLERSKKVDEEITVRHFALKWNEEEVRVEKTNASGYVDFSIINDGDTSNAMIAKQNHNNTSDEQKQKSKSTIPDAAELEERIKERKVVQIHYEGWPDFGVPEATEQFRKLLCLMERLNEEGLYDGDNCKHSILLHCSAGLGRTGTLIAAHIASMKLEKKLVQSSEEIDLKKLVAQLREQRAGMVQTKEQYKFLHQVVKEFAEKGLPRNMDVSV